MPPKAPNLKFRPKLVAQTKQPAPSPPTDEWEGLSAVQVERLRRQQEQQQQQDSAAGAASTATAGVAAFAPGGAPAPEGQAPGAAPDTTAPGGRSGGTGASGARGDAPQSPFANFPVRKSAAAQLQEAVGRYVDLNQFSEHAEPLPANTINEVLAGDADAGDFYAEENDGRPRAYRPTPIDDVAAAEKELADARAGVTAAPKVAETDGTAFLRAIDDEQEAACAANRHFYEDKLASGVQGTAVGDPGHLVWMQIPRFHGRDAPFSLQDMPPGRVGELKVLRSGRMVMEIAGVHYDVWVDGVGTEGSACATVGVTQPPTFPADETASGGKFYEVGRLEKKMICVPTIHDS